MTVDVGTLFAAIVAGVAINAMVQGTLAAFRQSNAIAVMQIEIAQLKRVITELKDAIRDSACRATGGECAPEQPTVQLRKVEKMQ